MFNDFSNRGFGFSFLLKQFDLHLLFTFFKQELCLTENLLTLFEGLVD
ncbi:MAG: hypothetical protein ACK521_02825 [bacterium]